MGFRIDFKVDGGELIDDNYPIPVYSEEIHVAGNSITDTICISQDGSLVWFTVNQYKEFIEKALESSLFNNLKDKL